jgi:hypothetical protein
MKKYAIIHESKTTRQKIYFVCEDDNTLYDNESRCRAYFTTQNQDLWGRILHELDLQGIEIYTLENGEELPFSLDIIEHEIYY